jgi:hypothetical protein
MKEFGAPIKYSDARRSFYYEINGSMKIGFFCEQSDRVSFEKYLKNN